MRWETAFDPRPLAEHFAPSRRAYSVDYGYGAEAADDTPLWSERWTTGRLRETASPSWAIFDDPDDDGNDDTTYVHTYTRGPTSLNLVLQEHPASPGTWRLTVLNGVLADGTYRWRTLDADAPYPTCQPVEQLFDHPVPR